MSMIYSQFFRRPFPSINAAMTSSTGSFKLVLLQTTARPVHHNAVTLVETLCWGSQRQQKRRPGQAKQMQELEIV